MNTKIIRIENLMSKNGKPFAVVWVSAPSGLPVKVAVFDNLDSYKVGDSVVMEIVPDRFCNASITLHK